MYSNQINNIYFATIAHTQKEGPWYKQEKNNNHKLCLLPILEINNTWVVFRLHTLLSGLLHVELRYVNEEQQLSSYSGKQRHIHL